MTDNATPDSMQIPADLIRDAVAAGLAKSAPDAKPALEIEAKPDVKPEPKPDTIAVPPASAESRRRAPSGAAFGAWAKTIPGRVRAAKPNAVRRPAAIAAGLMALAAGLGYGAARLSTAAVPNADAIEQRWSEAAAGLKQNHSDVARLAVEMKSLHASIDALKGDRPRAELSTKQAQLNDKFDKAAADSTAKIAKLAEQLDRIEKTQRDPARIATLVERLDRIEKQTASVPEKAATPTPPPKPVALAPAPAASDVTQTGSLAEAKPVAKLPEFDPRKTQLESYVLRDVDDGAALIEGRNGRVFEAHPGQVISGLGKIEAIERRGRQWVVVTAKGFIGERLP